MDRHVAVLPVLLACGVCRPALAEDDVVFRSDVSLIRVDAQVVDRDNRAITGLRAEDFVLREEGRSQDIRHFASENMPVDVLLLLDVSTSMRPHVERIAAAAHQALRVLGDNDRVAIMVFDRAPRVRLPFRASRGDVERELDAVLSQERFDGGTDITRGLLDAARYLAREGRRDARRAIVILTDDQTERERDEAAVSRALENANAVLSALLAPDAMRNRQAWPGQGGPWPGGHPRGPLGGVILGRRGPYGGRYPGPASTGPRTQSAGTAEIARRSGGDSMAVDDASAFETTLARIRQRYALYFNLPPGLKPGEEREIEVELAQTARARHPGAEVRFRRAYQTPGADAGGEPVAVTLAPVLKRRPAVNEPSGGPRPDSTGGWRRVGEPAQEPPPAASPQGGWRRVPPNDRP